MNLLISHIPDTECEFYFKLLWRIPYDYLVIEKGWQHFNHNTIDYEKTLTEQLGGNKFKNIIFWNCNTLIKKYWKELRNIEGIKYYYMDDMHQIGKTNTFRQKVINNFDYILASYAYCIDKYFEDVNKEKIIWLPHYINDDFNVGFNDEPMEKISVTGAINQDVYPVRHRMAHKKDDRIEVLKFIGYKAPRHEYFGKDYIRFLNRYLVSFTCCSYERSPYVLSKFFEIPASGSLLLAHDELIKEQLEELGFIDGENYISMSLENMDEKINYVLDSNNREEIDRIRKNGYELVWSNHKISDRFKKIFD